MTVDRDTGTSSIAAHQAMTSWNDAVVPLLMEYGRIPNLSPAYDP